MDTTGTDAAGSAGTADGPDPAELARLVDEAIEDECPDELADLAVTDPAALRPYLERLLDAELHYPYGLYLGAGPDFQRLLVDRLDAGGDAILGLLLAQGRGPVVEAWLRGVPDPAFYTHQGGWEFAPDGSVRELCAPVAHALLPEPGSPVDPADGPCPWCGSPLWTVLDVDTADPRVAAALAHTRWSGRLRAVACFLCHCYGTTYAEVAGDGSSRLLTERPPRSLPAVPHRPEQPRPVRFTVGARLGTPFGSNPHSDGGSTLGGRPDWEQDADYPPCPECGTTMDYVGLIGAGDLGDLLDGCSYVFVHAPCGRAAVVFQQT